MKRLLPPYLLNGPALLIFAVMLAVPLAMTFMLSFNSFDFYGGIKQDFGWHNYYEVISDNYFPQSCIFNLLSLEEIIT